MIGPTGPVKVMVATKPVDFHKGAEGLVALVREQIGADPFGGTVFVFRAKRTDRVKLIFWDGTGMFLFAKRLEDGWMRLSCPHSRGCNSIPGATSHLTPSQIDTQCLGCVVVVSRATGG